LKNFVKWWLPVLIWMGVIFAGSSIGSLPRVGGRTSDTIVHRVAHVIEFAVLGALTLRAVSKDRPVTRRDVINSVIIVTLYGLSDELHQRFTPGRSSEGSAVLFDAAGGLIGAWVYRWLLTANKRLSKSVNQRSRE
jgi:VanZ family protein